MAKCLEAIRRLTTPAGVPPSIGQLQAEMGYAYPAALHGLLVKMRARGLITWEPRRARTLQLVEPRISRAELAHLSTDELRRVVGFGLDLLAQRDGVTAAPAPAQAVGWGAP